ncbi:MAG: thiamine-phosphate kinase [Longimicrobiales bacterium]
MRRPALGAGREFEILRRIIARQPVVAALADRLFVGPGDDCVVLRAGTIALSVDMSIEDVHFRRDWLTARGIGYRGTVAALSDLAAMAATPVGVLASIAASGEDPSSLVDEIAAGVEEAATTAGASVLGGDLARTPGPIILDIAVLGDAPEPVARDGARPGDALWVTGSLGGARAAVDAWLAGEAPNEEAANAFRRPVARVREARWLARRRLTNALIDLSDGLVGDAGHIAAASGVGIVLARDRVPVHAGAAAYARDRERALALALGGGDDYELCFAAPAGAVEAVAGEFMSAFGIALTHVGDVVEGGEVLVRAPDGILRPPAAASFSHFTGPDS